MKAFALHFSCEFLAGLRNKTLLLMNYLMPLGFFGVVGGMMSAINPSFGEQMIPAMVTFAVLSGAILGLPAPLVEAREAQILRSFKINGVPALSLLAIPALSTALHLLVASAVITVAAPLFFSSPLPENWPAYLLLCLLFLLTCCSLGLLIGVVSGSSRSTILWSQLIYLPSMILSGMMVPADLLPETFVRIGHLLPASYAMQSFLGLAYGWETLYPPAAGALVLLAGGIIASGLALYLFNWDRRNNTRRGHPALAALALLPYLLGALLLV